jgi:hypothetical protein
MRKAFRQILYVTLCSPAHFPLTLSDVLFRDPVPLETLTMRSEAGAEYVELWVAYFCARETLKLMAAAYQEAAP